MLKVDKLVKLILFFKLCNYISVHANPLAQCIFGEYACEEFYTSPNIVSLCSSEIFAIQFNVKLYVPGLNLQMSAMLNSRHC